MKRLVSMFLVIALVFVAYDAMGQTVVLKKYGKSMNMQKMQSGTTIWEQSTGLKIVGKGGKVYLVADTTGSGATPVTSFTWTMNGKPANSAAVLDSGASKPFFNSFTADSTGYYYVSVTVNGGATSGDTTYASTYYGVNRNDMFNAPNGCYCHGAPGTINTKFTEWQGSNHATMLYRGFTGQLEVVAETNQGLYAKGCPKCHTTGYDLTLNNGNWAYLARYANAGYDTTWYVGLPTTADGADVMITYKDTTTVWKNMPAGLMKTANIGCENCHGPLGQHVASFGQKQYVGKTLAADVCNVCHDGSTKHSIGSYFRGSGHDLMPKEGGATSSSCSPCHYGGSFIRWTQTGKPWSGSGSSASFQSSDIGTRITCAVCHDPHTMEFRTTGVDSLQNGFKPGTAGGIGQLCMNCHRGRTNYTTYVKPASAPYYGFKSRFYPHHSNQADMLFGQNSYEFGDAKIHGLSTHAGVEASCVTCHMGMRNGLPNHFFSNDPTEPNYTLLGGARNYNPVDNCKPCHGEIADYNEIKAMYDYDGDGAVEGVESEVEGLMTTLEARLPKTSTGEVIGEGTVTAADSAAIMNRLDLVEGIWVYWYVYMDGSKGMHNAKYTIALLQKALGLYPLAVDRTDLNTPSSYALEQNYPNPFNPSTTITFSLPKSGHARVDVYDILGKHVTTLIDENMGSGNFRVTWDGADKSGSRVSSGMYIYRMVSGSFSMTKKMLMVK